MKSKLFTFAAALMLAAVVGGFYAMPALAAVVKAALVQDVDSPARHFVSFEFANAYPGASTYTVPAGKILVIESVSATGIPVAGGFFLSYSGDIGTASNTHRWDASFVPNNSAFYQLTKIYAQGGQVVRMDTNNAAAPQLYVQGYLIDAN